MTKINKIKLKSISLAILHLYPHLDPLKDFIIYGDNEGEWIEQWNVSDPQPTPNQIIEAMNNYRIQKEALAYREKRASEYPSIGDQLDALWKMIDPPIGSEAELIKQKILKIKAKYPKTII